MPILTKPCKGILSEQTLQSIHTSGDRADWGVYPCEACGQSVGIVSTNGTWMLERHWPSVVYTRRKPSVSRYTPKVMMPAKLRAPAR